MSKHTKGPWSVTYTHGKGYPGQIEADNGTLITTWGSICRKSTAEGQANAELMAAAPELLEALEGLRDFCEQAGFPCDRANRVIAKAKGETA